MFLTQKTEECGLHMMALGVLPLSTQTSNPRYLLTYEDENSKSLRVIDWGPATGTHLVDPERRLQKVECWQVLWVNAYVRHFPRRSQLCGEPGWVHWATFPVMQWSEIPNVFKDYFATGGLYTTVSFHVVDLDKAMRLDM